MIKLDYRLTWLVAIVLLFSACSKEPIARSRTSSTDGTTAVNVTADFSRYIAVGNSITAGYSNGGLYLDGQKVAYPNIIAEQLKAAGGGSFTSPFFSDAQSNGSGYLRLIGFNPDGSPNIVPVTDKLAIRGVVNIPGFGDVTLLTKYAGDINNYGVPGLKLQQITYAPLGNLNPYFERILPGNAGTNATPYLDFVTAKPYTFFSCWLGNNDALGYATSGGSDSLTDKSLFAGLYELAISTLTKNGAQGVVATVPDVTVLPYLNTVTIKAIVEKIKDAFSGLKFLYISAVDPATGKYITRAATDEDLLGLDFKTSDIGSVMNGIPGYGITISNPINAKDVLDAAEVARAHDYVLSYNAIIKAVATAHGLPVFDSFDFLNKVKAGMVVNGVPLNSSFITGGVFSLDGVHLTPRGNALAADEFIKAINAKYGTNIQLVDISTYKGVL